MLGKVSAWLNRPPGYRRIPPQRWAGGDGGGVLCPWPSGGGVRPSPALPWEGPGHTVLSQNLRAVNSTKSLHLTAPTPDDFNTAPWWKQSFCWGPRRCKDSKRNNTRCSWHLTRGGGGCAFKECVTLHQLLSVQTRRRWTLYLPLIHWQWSTLDLPVTHLRPSYLQLPAVLSHCENSLAVAPPPAPKCSWTKCSCRSDLITFASCYDRIAVLLLGAWTLELISPHQSFSFVLVMKRLH